MPIAASGANQDPPVPECSTTNAITSAITTDQLDPQVWQKLPHELLEKVHLCLPLRSLARFRSVCRGWNTTVLDEGFIRARAQTLTQKPWIVMTSTANSISIYDSGLETWLTLPIPFNASNLHVVAAAGGLLCFSNAWFQWPRMAVLNPLTNQWRRLPRMSTWMITTVGMVYRDASRSYQILVCGRREDHSMITEVYDSATGAWAPGGIPSASRKYGGDTLVWREGIFYCLTFPFSTLSLIAYDLAGSTWHEVPVTMPSPIMSPSVVVCDGRLLLVGAMEDDDEGSGSEPEYERAAFAIQIWELDFDRFIWIPLERMPGPVCRDFEAKMMPSKPLSCFGTGDQLFFTIPCSSAYLPALVYDLNRRTWTWWPASGFPPHLPDVNIGRSCGISFEPRLHARV